MNTSSKGFQRNEQWYDMRYEGEEVGTGENWAVSLYNDQLNLQS